ncbi:hypothetical protein LTR50_001174 [Elasticomyces elasticus]|nr:hypothetical protein LTR50_001174 [Elasticomyces elasticus]
MLHGEVGTGKSMLIDLFADCLPNRKKRRWHFNTFMLETFAKLEGLRKSRLLHQPTLHSGLDADEDSYSLLWLARDLIKTSPIMFLDEFQLPDRAASGVLVATSNRMPEDLSKAAGMTYAPPPPSRLDSLSWRLGLGRKSTSGRSENMFGGQSEFAQFLEVLRARCEVWEMGGGKDYRRIESEDFAPALLSDEQDFDREPVLEGYQDQSHVSGLSADYPASTTLDQARNSDGSNTASSTNEDTVNNPAKLPKNYHVMPSAVEVGDLEHWLSTFRTAEQSAAAGNDTSRINEIKWEPSSISVYGRRVSVPRAYDGVTSWTFQELCGSMLGPADYISLASTYHTLILVDVPVLTWLMKNEARRFITLLDALYEARCKLLISAAAGPDELFFPEKTAAEPANDGQDAVYPETLSEVYQDATAPFRPNILTENPAYDERDYDLTYSAPKEPDYTHARLAGVLPSDALEDDPPNRPHRINNPGIPIDPDEPWTSRTRPRGPDFAKTAAFTGEDERFAYKRARSRLWEMCSARWWARQEEGWHRPLPLSARTWERLNERDNLLVDSAIDLRVLDGNSNDGATTATMQANREGVGRSRDVDEKQDEVLFRHTTSPFRTSREPPPKFSWTHIWGTVKWGKKAGAWGQGVEGLKDRNKDSSPNVAEKRDDR